MTWNSAAEWLNDVMKGKTVARVLVIRHTLPAGVRFIFTDGTFQDVLSLCGPVEESGEDLVIRTDKDEFGPDFMAQPQEGDQR